jgi:hypothetical protein
MDARLVWDTWRRILTDDQLVQWVAHDQDRSAGPPGGLTAEEAAIVADYARTPIATDTNIGMFRRGLVRNALAALSYVPLTHGLLYASGLDVEAVAADFMRATGYADEGPRFWRIAAGFVAHLAGLPEFAAPLAQDVLALDASAIALARRLGQSAPELWPDRAFAAFSEAGTRVIDEAARFVASRAAVVVSTRYDLTAWIEDPHAFDPGEQLEPSTRHWLIYFPVADAAPAYAELSERSARAFNLLATPKTAAELSLALGGLPEAEVRAAMTSLAESGFIADQRHQRSSLKAAQLPGGGRELQGETLHLAPRAAAGTGIT